MAKTIKNAYTPRLKALYDGTYKKELQAELGLSNIHQVPKLEKIVVSVGLGKNKDDKRHYEVVSVTLRGARMYEFMDRFINVAMPRIRDFHGVGLKAFDKGGNYNVGITEQSIFPELTFEETQVLHGLQVTFVIENQDVAHSRALLEKFGMPFEKEGGRR